MNESMKARVISDVPGRMRLKFAAPGRAAAVDEIGAALEERDGIRELKPRPEIGSLTIHYDGRALSSGELRLALRDLDVALDAADAPRVVGDDVDQGQSEPAVATTTLLSRFDRRLSLATDRKMDLKLLFPLGFLVVGIRNTFANGLGLGRTPGYVMLWYAFDAFYKLHQEDPAKPKGEQKAQQEDASAGSMAKA